MEAMTNDQMIDCMKALYNTFWRKWRDNVPLLDDDKAWDTITTEVTAMMRDYPAMTNTILDFLSQIEYRSRQMADN